MPHVSKKKLKHDALEKIQKRFLKTIVSLDTDRKALSVLEDLLTPTEQLMLAKRLSVIYLLFSGISSYQISRVLGVSESTVHRIRAGIKEKEFEHLVALFERQDVQEQFWRDMEVVFRLGMPPMGKRRWDWLDKFIRINNIMDDEAELKPSIYRRFGA